MPLLRCIADVRSGYHRLTSSLTLETSTER